MKIFCHLHFEMQLLFFSSLKVVDNFFNLIKKLTIIEYFWHYEVEQTPQLLKIVTERSPSHQQLESGIEMVKSGKILTLEVFYFMSLVHNQHLPIYPRQRIKTLLDPFISGDHNVKFSRFDYLPQTFLPLLLSAHQKHNVSRRKPFVDLPDPVVRHRFGTDHQMLPTYSVFLP